LGVKVSSVPHDLLKVVDWGKHASKSAVERFFPAHVRGTYKISYKDVEGKIKFLTLEQVIEGHHSEHRYWEALWSYSDKLSTPAGRFRLEYDYWHWSNADPFLVKVYGDIREWTRYERDELAKSIIAVLEKYCDAEEQHKAFEEINDLLGDFPSDSRFPYTSLKTHHWLTDAIRRNETFWARLSSARKLRGGEPTFNNLYIVRISISETQFHRLKEIRGFIELREKILEITKGRLSSFSPLQVGDDLYIVCLEENELKGIISLLAETGFGFDVSVFEWSITREERHVRVDRPEKIYIIKEAVERPQISIGAYESLDYSPESSAEYSKILEGDYEYVAWISIQPKGDMKELSQKFLEWGESELKSRYAGRRRGLKEPVREPTALLSPEIALSIAEGYDEFLEDCAKMINPINPQKSIVTKSFSRTILIRGLNEPSEALQTYNGITNLKTKLHIPIVFSIVVAKPKYPFWRILELFRHNANYLIFIVGEKMSELTDKHARLIESVIQDIRNERKRQFYKIVNSARKDSKEILKVKINGLASENKLRKETASKLCKIVDEIARESSGDENKRKRITYEVFKILRMFASAR